MAKDWVGGTASTFKTIGASNHCDHERQEHDYYATEPLATRLLCDVECLAPKVWEPACGEGHMANVLKDYHYEVHATDLVDRGYGDVMDFLTANEQWDGDIVTNPPYKYAQEFVEKALSLIPDGRKVCMFLKLTFLEGKKRRELFKNYPPQRIYVSSSRLKCAMNGDFESVGGSATCYAWFVWVKGYSGAPMVHWIN